MLFRQRRAVVGVSYLYGLKISSYGISMMTSYAFNSGLTVTFLQPGINSSEWSVLANIASVSVRLFMPTAFSVGVVTFN